MQNYRFLCYNIGDFRKGGYCLCSIPQNTFTRWRPNFKPGLKLSLPVYLYLLHGFGCAAFACQSGAGAEKAFGKLKDSIGIGTLAATLILIDPKDKPSDDNERKIEEFCKDI